MTGPNLADLESIAADPASTTPAQIIELNKAIKLIRFVRNLMQGACPTCGLTKQAVVINHTEPDPEKWISVERHNAIIKGLHT